MWLCRYLIEIAISKRGFFSTLVSKSWALLSQSKNGICYHVKTVSSCPGKVPGKQQDRKFLALRMTLKQECHMWYRLSYGAVPPLRFPCNIVRAEGTENFKALERWRCHFLKPKAVSVWEEHFPSLEGGMLIGQRAQNETRLCSGIWKAPNIFGFPAFESFKSHACSLWSLRLWVQKEALAQCRTKFLFWFEKCI